MSLFLWALGDLYEQRALLNALRCKRKRYWCLENNVPINTGREGFQIITFGNTKSFSEVSCIFIDWSSFYWAWRSVLCLSVLRTAWPRLKVVFPAGCLSVLFQKIERELDSANRSLSNSIISCEAPNATFKPFKQCSVKEKSILLVPG